MVYNSLFYNLYRTIKYFDKRKRYPEIAHAINASFFVSVHIAVNIFIIAFIIQRNTNIYLTKYHYCYFISVVIFNLFYFLRKNHYIKIENDLLQKSLRFKTISIIGTILYIVLTLGSIVLVSIN